jgi:hypothetical protein
MANQPVEKPSLDNHADQLNRNSDAFWQARGFLERPPDWEKRDPEAPPEKPSATAPVAK